MKRMTDNTINENIVQPLEKSTDNYGNPYYETSTNVFAFAPNDNFQEQFNSPDWNKHPERQLNNIWGQIYAQKGRFSNVAINDGGITMYNLRLADNGWNINGYPSITPTYLGSDDNMVSGINLRLARNKGNNTAIMKISYNGISFDSKSILNYNQYKMHSIAVVSTQADKPAYVFFQITDGMLKNGNIQSLLDLYNYIQQGNGHMLCTGCIGGKQIVGIYENKFVFADGTSSTNNWNQEIIDNGTFTIKDYTKAGI